MKKLYNEFFCIPESGKGKIREKVMLTRVTLAVILILVCMISMSLTAYAYFSHSIVAGSNIVKAAVFDVDVSLINLDGVSDAPVVTEQNDKSFLTVLEKGEYSMTLSLGTENSVQTGFCIISPDGGITNYHTQQLGADGENTTQSITFNLVVNAEATQICIIPTWGTSSYYADYINGIKNELYIADKDTVTLASAEQTNPVADEPLDEPDAQPDQTEQSSDTVASSSEETTATDGGTAENQNDSQQTETSSVAQPSEEETTDTETKDTGTDASQAVDTQENTEEGKAEETETSQPEDGAVATETVTE